MGPRVRDRSAARTKRVREGDQRDARAWPNRARQIGDGHSCALGLTRTVGVPHTSRCTVAQHLSSLQRARAALHKTQATHRFAWAERTQYSI